MSGQRSQSNFLLVVPYNFLLDCVKLFETWNGAVLALETHAKLCLRLLAYELAFVVLHGVLSQLLTKLLVMHISDEMLVLFEYLAR